jgi:hypothetical protein
MCRPELESGSISLYWVEVVDLARRLAHQLLNSSRGDQEDARGAASQGLFSVQSKRGSDVSGPTQSCKALNDAQHR